MLDDSRTPDIVEVPHGPGSMHRSLEPLLPVSLLVDSFGSGVPKGA